MAATKVEAPMMRAKLLSWKSPIAVLATLKFSKKIAVRLAIATTTFWGFGMS